MGKTLLFMLVSFSAFIGSVWGMPYKGFFHKFISFGLAAVMLLAWADIRILSRISLILLIFFALMTIVYGLVVKNLYLVERLSISFVSFLLFLNTLFTIQHYPGAQFLQLSLIIPVISYLFCLSKRITKELSFMIFWITMAVIQIFNLARINLIVY